MARLHLAAHTFGSVYRQSMRQALEACAAAGFRTIELAATPPHLYTPGLSAVSVRELRRALEDATLHCSSLTPTFGDLNLASPNDAVRDLSTRQVEQSIRLAHEIGAPIVVIIPGRRHPLVPQPALEARDRFRRSLEQILPCAMQLAVKIGLENFAAGIADRGEDLARLTADYGDRVGVVYDVANGLAVEDPVVGLRSVSANLALVHISDSKRARWTHGRIGTGEIDFAAVAAVLREIRFAGVTVYELLESDDPFQDMGSDAIELERLGWSR